MSHSHNLLYIHANDVLTQKYKSATTYHIAEQSKLTKSHLCGLKLKESAYLKKEKKN